MKAEKMANLRSYSSQRRRNINKFNKLVDSHNDLADSVTSLREGLEKVYQALQILTEESEELVNVPLTRKWRHPYGATHYVIPIPILRVQEADYFCDQKGHLNAWGADWIPVVAEGSRHARLIAYVLQRNWNDNNPLSLEFNYIRNKTVLQFRNEGFSWVIE